MNSVLSSKYLNKEPQFSCFIKRNRSFWQPVCCPPQLFLSSWGGQQTGCPKLQFVLIYLYTFAVSPSLGGSQRHKRTTKTMGVLLRSSSNDEGPGQVWMALLEQHSPSSPIFHNFCRFIDAILIKQENNWGFIFKYKKNANLKAEFKKKEKRVKFRILAISCMVPTINHGCRLKLFQFFMRKKSLPKTLIEKWGIYIPHICIHLFLCNSITN